MCRMPSSWFAVTVVLLVASSRGEAQGPVAVSFELDLPAMTGLWEEEGQPEATVAELRAYLVGRLNERFKFWRFVEGGPGLPVRMELRLVEGGPGEALIEFDASVAGQDRADLVLSERLWEPLRFGTEIEKPRADITVQVFDSFKKLLSEDEQGRRIETWHSRIESWLQDWVPIGKEGRWDASSDPVRAPYLLLPLRRELRLSRFRLRCRWTEGSPLVHTVGTGRDRPGADPEDPSSTQPSGVLVTLPSHIEYAGRRLDVQGPKVETLVGPLELIQLQPQSVFLVEYVPDSELFRVDASGGVP